MCNKHDRKTKKHNCGELIMHTFDACFHLLYQQPMKEIPLILPVYKGGSGVCTTCQRSDK